MKFRTLELLRFGPFTDITLDLSAGNGLHVLFGANEAGKSTTLRAIGGLLFGIPEATRDAHVHKMPDLRIGAELETADGARIRWVRRKGRGATLTDHAGAAVDEDRWRATLGGLPRETFDALFGLDHGTLRDGGDELLRVGGNVGTSLFGAGLGGGGIRRVQRILEEQATAVFVPQGKNPALNRALRDFQDAKKRVHDLSLRVTDWTDLDALYQAVLAQRAEVDVALRARAMEHRRLQRLTDALPLFARRQDARRRRHDLGDVVLLPETATTDRRDEERSRRNAAAEEHRLRHRLDQLDARLAALVVPEELLDQEAAITALQSRALRFRQTTLEDLPRLRAEETLLLRDAADRDADLPTPPDPEGLRAVLEQARGLGDLDERVRRSETESAVQARDVTQKLAALGHRSGSLDEAVRLPLPTAETLMRFEQDFARIAAARERAVQRREEHRAAQDEADRRIEELRGHQDVPTEADLVAARGARDHTWLRLRGNLHTQVPGDLPATDLADEFDRHLQRADELSDRLRREADRVATLASLLTQRTDHDRRAQAHQRQENDLAAAEAACTRAWQEAWAPSAIEPRSPTEMRGWLARHDRLVDAVAALDQRQAQHRELLEVRALHVQELAAKLSAPAALPSPESDRNGLLAPRLTQAERVLLAHDQRREIDQLRDQRTALERTSQDFLRDTRRLLDRFLPSTMEVPDTTTPGDDVAIESALNQLARRLHQAREDRAERSALLQQRQELAETLASLVTTQKTAQAQLDELARKARCASPEDLEQAELRSGQAYALDMEIQATTTRLLELAGSLALDELAAQTVDIDADAIHADRRACEQELEQLAQRRSELDHRAGGLAEKLAGLDGQSAAAQAAMEAQEALARIVDLSGRYLRHRLAALLLREEMERYRQKNQGPVLRRASELFIDLTCHHYSGVRAGFDEKDQPVLFCVRPDHREIPIAGLSDGTRDQLYLSLRLAALERYVECHEPIPFVVDDILVHFDDARAAAALRVLGDVATRTQILFFTHHARLVELATDAVAPNRLFVHNLPSYGP